MRRITLYLETSVWNFHDDTRDPAKREATRSLFASAQAYDLYYSEVVVLEIEACPEPKRSGLYNLIERHKPFLLPQSPEATALAETYIREHVVPRAQKNDALHLAIASTLPLNAVVSWNLRHLVRFQTRRLVTSINLREGYPPVDIVTPEEVIP